MQRNLDHRVELVFPIEAELMPRAEEILEVMWSDNVNTRVMQPDTSYQLIDRRGSRKLNNSHRTFFGYGQSRFPRKAQKQFEQVQETTEFKVHQSADQN